VGSINSIPNSNSTSHLFSTYHPKTTMATNGLNKSSLNTNPYSVTVVDKNTLPTPANSTSNSIHLTSSNITSVGRSNSLPTPRRSYIPIPSMPTQNSTNNTNNSNSNSNSNNNSNNNVIPSIYHSNNINTMATTISSNVPLAGTNRQSIAIPTNSLDYTSTMGALVSNVSSNVISTSNITSTTNVFLNPSLNTTAQTLTNNADASFQNTNPWLLDFQPLTSSYHQHYPNYHMNTIKNSAMEAFNFSSANPTNVNSSTTTTAAGTMTQQQQQQESFYFMNLNNEMK